MLSVCFLSLIIIKGLGNFIMLLEKKLFRNFAAINIEYKNQIQKNQ